MYFSIMNENVTASKKYTKIYRDRTLFSTEHGYKVANSDLYNKLNQDLNTDPNYTNDILLAEL